MLLLQLHVRVSSLLTSGKHPNDRSISLRREVRAHKTSLTRHFFLSKCFYQARKVSVLVYMFVRSFDFISFSDLSSLYFWNCCKHFSCYFIWFIIYIIIIIIIIIKIIIIIIIITRSKIFSKTVIIFPPQMWVWYCYRSHINTYKHL
jgi:hypothetical protein